MPIMTQGFPDLLTPEFQDLFIDVGDEHPPEYADIFNIEDMEYREHKQLQISGLGNLVAHAEGADFITDEPIMGGNKTYEATGKALAVLITREMMEDDQYQLVDSLVSELARASRHQVNEEAFTVLDDAFDATKVGFTAGEPLCSTAHAVLGGGAAIANRPNPDVEFGITAMQVMMIDQHKLVNERGRQVTSRPVMVAVSPDDIHVAREVLGSSHIPGSDNNELNALIHHQLRWMVLHFIASTTAWFGFTEKRGHDLHLKIRTNPVFTMWTDPRNLNTYASVWQRNTHGFGSWRGTYGSDGTP